MRLLDADRPRRPLLLLAATALVLALLLAVAAQASAAVSWELSSQPSVSRAAPGEQVVYGVYPVNAGGSATDGGTVTLEAHVPAGMTLLGAIEFNSAWSCAVTDATDAACTTTEALKPTAGPESRLPAVLILAMVEPGLDPSQQPKLAASFSIAGGEGSGPSDAIDDVIATGTGPQAFGIDAFDSWASNAAGASYAQAGGEPYALTTAIGFDRATDPLHGSAWPTGQVRDIVVDTPPGLVGNPTLPTCKLSQLAGEGEGHSVGGAPPACPVGSQIGAATVFTPAGAGSPAVLSLGQPLYNLVAPPGEAARFGFNVEGTLVTLDATVRGGGDYGVTITVHNISEGIANLGSLVTLWGDPSDPSHDRQRACPGELIPWNTEFGVTCPSEGEGGRFLRLPTSCATDAGQVGWSVNADSWAGQSDSRSISGHLLPGYPADPSGWGPPSGSTGCAAVPFEPGVTAQPTSDEAGAPTGLSVDVSMPQGCWAPGAGGAPCESDLRKAVVTLPEGMSVNPAQVAGLGVCTNAQIGLLGTSFPQPAPIRFTDQAPACPEDSKIGSVSIQTPLLDHAIQAGIYLAAQNANPFGSLLALYVAGRDPASGLTIKLPARIELDPSTGRLTTVFEENPQLPFTDFHFALKSGPRAPLVNPIECGTKTVTTRMTAWSGATAAPAASFQIASGCPGGGFSPQLSAGATDSGAGSYSPFDLRVTRGDGQREIDGLTASLPKGLLGRLAGVGYCPDSVLASISGAEGTGQAQVDSPSCPASSQVGTVTVGAGAGPNPFYTAQGRVYLAGPYKGAPLSLAVVTPAVAGPFDLGTVVVRNALRIDPLSAAVTAQSDPIPTILHGIPLDLRDIRVELQRPQFTLNPTSCEAMSVAATISGTGGASAAPANRFQAAGCQALGFKPALTLRLKGGTRRAKNPGLTAVLRPRAGDANLGRVQVALPHSEFLDQGHIKTICTRVQFAAGDGNGSACPRGSVYGKVSATSPLLGYELTGKVYLRSSSHKLPDMVLALNGPASQPIAIDAVGRIDSHKGGIRTTFEGLPDAPLTQVVLKLPAGRKSLIENSADICAKRQKAEVKMDAQSGKVHDFKAPLRVTCPKARKHRAAKAGHHRHHRS
jgi:hypothetical protein